LGGRRIGKTSQFRACARVSPLRIVLKAQNLLSVFYTREEGDHDLKSIQLESKDVQMCSYWK
jgi:hypothetical protein